ncbi:Glucosyltransferase Alg10 [Macleaya cordata]|uniref:Dol-P-Glc:Glc(2)Man(9)GlcNAc(2)-PP-Dol alpha-1,2-glucosyltransferase n=1 Tax=Macleaya cordata TaxID=56857 RepID=A0A200Q6Y9_MACCD|nr:Glucosyltransferase Alg10 [Macleaya cordata]
MGRVAVAVIVSLWVIPISLMVNHIVPEPYMDEIFHIPQAQKYCRGNFKSWDPLITTPPGLYCLSLAHVASLFPGMWCAKAVSSFSKLCSTPTLRSINGVLAVICSVLVYEILAYFRPALDKRNTTLRAIVTSLYPLHWFFTFLYYTDVASLTLVLAMYLACLKRHYQSSALLGALAILVRQTNVIWMLFVACCGAINLTLPPNHKVNVQLDDHDAPVRKNDWLPEKKSMPVGPNLRKRKMDSTSISVNHSIPKMNDLSLRHTSGLLDEIKVILLRMWNLKLEVLVSFGPFFVVFVAFVMFVFWNGSIVLGAKEAHAVSLHFAQIMYFGLVSALAMAPFYFTYNQVAVLCQSLWKNRPLSFFQVIVLLISGFLSVHLFSIAHPYLLADNRHYTFYIWRRVIKSHWLMKYLLLPLYAYSWLCIFDSLGKVQKKIWVLLFFLASAGVLIPAPLIEFRYYTIPFYFLVLHSPIDDNRSWDPEVYMVETSIGNAAENRWALVQATT